MASHNKTNTKSADVQAAREQNAKNQRNSNIIKRFKLIGIWGIVIIALALVIYGLYSFTTTDTSKMPTLLVGRVGSTDHWAGNNNSKVLLVEYSDLQCPACAQFNTIVKKAVAEKGDKFQFVYRHFPLKLIHNNAVSAAKASEAAALQGKFWEMVNLLFEKQDEWESDANIDVFSLYATELGMDEIKFRADFKSKDVAAKVENDYVSGVRYQIQSTPTFYLNGLPVKFKTYDELAALIDRYSK